MIFTSYCCPGRDNAEKTDNNSKNKIKMNIYKLNNIDDNIIIYLYLPQFFISFTELKKSTSEMLNLYG
jgi:hypothetical protein